MTTLDAINIGAAPNDNTGDPIRDGGQKINSNQVKLLALTKIIEFGNLQIYKFEGNANINDVELKDIVIGIINSAGVRYFIKAQYEIAVDPTDFGTVGGLFNDGNYKTLTYQNIEP